MNAPQGSFVGRAFRRALRLGWWTLLALPFLALPMNAGIEYSNSPDFCNSCHIMEPFYDAWKAGSHKDVACTKCHYPPDLEGKLWVKFQGLAQLVSYVTKTESTRPSAHVHDGSCTQCHPVSTLQGELAFGATRFRHDKHFDAATPGHELKCTSCHAQTTRDTHMAVDRAACNLCHFKDQAPGHAVGECTACHALPQKTVTPEGGGPAFEHGAVALRGRACADCHAGITRGTGDVAKTRCLQCHADPAALATFDAAIADREAADRLHFAHVKSAAVDCRSCHEEILHGSDAAKATPSHAASGGDCRACHADRHEPQRDFALGKGARTTTGKPDFMAHLGMRCEACHREPPAAGGEVGGAAKGDPESACFACHGAGVRGMTDSWKLALRSWDEAARKDLATVEAALGATPPSAARDALAAVRADLDLVRRANGVHNFEYAAGIYRGVRAKLAETAQAAGKTPEFAEAAPPQDLRGFRGALADPQILALGDWRVPKDAADCRSCHVGVERRSEAIGGYSFPHGPHLRKANLACDDCHAAKGETHGKLEMTLDRCTDCHHQEEEGCGKCHLGVADFYEGRGVPRLEQKPDPMAAQVACNTCHNDRAAKDQIETSRKMCVECHEPKYGPMLDDWMKEERALLAELTRVVQAARLEVLEADRRAAGYAEASRALDDAEKTLQIIRDARFVHNPALARDAVAEVKASLARASAGLAGR